MIKKVSPDAYRVALVVSPKEPNPFFIQIPPYSHYLNKLQDVSFPTGSTITAPQENQIELGLISDGRPTDFKCEHCGHDKVRRKGVYQTTRKPDSSVSGVDGFRLALDSPRRRKRRPRSKCSTTSTVHLDKPDKTVSKMG